MSNKKNEKTEAVSFSFEQLYNAKRYRGQKDVLCAVLDKSKAYSIEEADELLRKFYERQVN